MYFLPIKLASSFCGTLLFLFCFCETVLFRFCRLGASPALIGSVHRSVDGSFVPLNMTFPLYHTSQFVFVNTTSHPASHRTLMLINNAIDNFGTTCPTNTFGIPGIVMSHVYVDFTFVPSGRLIVSRCIAGWRFFARCSFHDED